MRDASVYYQTTVTLIVVGLFGACHSAIAAPRTINFNRDIRPILADRCFTCHGPDVTKRKGKLGIGTRVDSTRELPNGNRAIVPGKPAISELIYRVTTDDYDYDDRMPPLDSGLTVLASEAVLLEKWIKKGAEYTTHWLLLAPSQPKVPRQRSRASSHNAIDHFVQTRLNKTALKPNGTAAGLRPGSPMDRPMSSALIQWAKRSTYLTSRESLCTCWASITNGLPTVFKAAAFGSPIYMEA